MLDDEEEWVVYRNKERGYFNYTSRHNYASWARTHPKDRKFYTIMARGLTMKQAEAIVRLTKEEE